MNRGRRSVGVRSGALLSVLCTALVGCGGGGGNASSGDSRLFGSCTLFPSTAVFNSRIDDGAVKSFPVIADNATWISDIVASQPGAGTATNIHLHLDWGTSESQTQPASSYWGIPFNVVDGTSATTNWPLVSYASGWPEQSDCAVASGSSGYTAQADCSGVGSPHLPIPLDSKVKVEGGYCPAGAGNCIAGDHHVLIVDKSSCRLWEAYYSGSTPPQSSVNGPWSLLGSASWNLNSLTLRPDTWTSADAAGLPILPLLARVDEANTGQIHHALRVTLPDAVIANSHVWPARHNAGSAAGNIPFGALMRLNITFAIPTNWTTQAKAVAYAMQRHGLYVADIGSALYVQGAPSSQWQSDTWTQLQSITLNDLEFVDTTSITTAPGFNVNSMAASW